MNTKIKYLFFCIVIVLFLYGCTPEKSSVSEKNIALESGKELVEQTEAPKQELIPEPSITISKCSSQQIETCNEKCKEFGTSYSPENEACFNNCITGFNCSEYDSEDDKIHKSAVNASQPAYPRKSVTLYKGILMTTILTLDHSLANREDLLALGANTVALGVDVPYNDDGTLAEDRLKTIKFKTRDRIRYYKEAGLAVILTFDPYPAETELESGPIEEKIRENFLQSLEPFLLEIATIAEEENVEILATLIEVDFRLGVERSSTWGQEILPKIKKVYNGKVLWKGSLYEHTDKNINIDFSGYDIVGFTSFAHDGIATYQDKVDHYITTISKWATEDNVHEVFASEFGNYVSVMLPKQDEQKSIQYVFEQGKGRLDGFIVFDPPPGFGTPIKGTDLEKVVKEEFERLK